MIRTEDLTVYYGKHRGIVNVNLEVEQGEVFGFLGPNGAGKTTTQRVLLDIIRPSSGKATIFGLDCRKNGKDIRKRIGYLPGELKLYEHLTGSSYLRMIGSLDEKKPDKTFMAELCDRMDLDPSRKIREYSRGNKQKIGIVAAFMGKPDLLILDEPTTGLDPLKQQEVMDLVSDVKKDGRTVFLSSHILGEVQAVCDRVGIIRDGELVKTERVETLTRRQFRRIMIRTRKPVPEGTFSDEHVMELERNGDETEIVLEVRSGLEEVMKTLLTFGLDDLETRPVTLEEIFLAYYGKHWNGGK